jgi:antibiotic biosynthesis monooxygenase (ABM) superfamily enzyme
MTVQSASATAPVAAVSAPARPAAPSLAARTRMAGLVLIAVYPLVTALIYIIFPLTDGWESWQRTLLLAPLMVVSLVYVVIPTIQQRFGRFIATGRL